MPKPFRCRWRGASFVALLALSKTLSGSPAHAEEALLKGIQWGESQSALLAHLGARATVLPSPIDFGDSYTQIVLRNFVLGGVPLIAFFQIDKATRGLRRIQLERQRHGVNPPAFRGVIGGLEAEFGNPDAMCIIPPGPKSGYQAAAEFDWSRGNNLVRAVFRYDDRSRRGLSLARPDGRALRANRAALRPDQPTRHRCRDLPVTGSLSRATAPARDRPRRAGLIIRARRA